MRCFNTEAVCVPEEHYLVDVDTKASQIITTLIDERKYFTINRARQYGKTSMLAKLEEMLTPRYYVLSVSFQDTGNQEFGDDGEFVSYFTDLLSEVMQDVGFPDSLVDMWNDPTTLGGSWSKRPFSYLRRKIRELCKEAERPIVLMIDEVDCASNNQVFMSFLGTLRENYIASRKKNSREASFQSVILAGVTDIKHLKAKIRPEEEHRLNSPWNIAADFKVDMSFSAEEIAGMLREYEADHHTGMDVSAVSQEIRRLTSGYPFLVSWLCKQLDENIGDWTVEGVRIAGDAFQKIQNSLSDSIRKNVEEHPDLKRELQQILFYGKEYTYAPLQPETELGVMYGIFTEGDRNFVKISNLLFERFLTRYIIDGVCRQYLDQVNLDRGEFILDGHLDMVHVLNRFQAFLFGEYRNEDGAFIEQAGRLLFLAFVTPLINGTGHYYVEPQTRGNKRMDVVVSYGTEEHIVELKIWDGPAYRRDGIRQLEGYMESRGAHVGYLLSFNFQKTDRNQHGWLSAEETDKQIYEVVIQLTRKEE